MRMPRFRFTIRRMMVAVAVVGVVLAFEQWVLVEWEAFADRRDNVTDWSDAITFWSMLNGGAILITFAVIGIRRYFSAPSSRTPK